MMAMNAETRTRYLDGLGVVALALVLLVAMPALAVLLFVLRGVLVVAALGILAGAGVAFAVSRRFRGWLRYVGEEVVVYKGLKLATAVGLAPGHVWARLEGPSACAGADDLMQAALGPIDRVELPEVGRHVQAGEPLFRLHNGARSLAGASPLAGTVVAVNDALRGEPGRVNAAPFTAGWTVRLAGGDDRQARKRLRRGLEARELFRREVDRFLGAVAAGEGVPSLADGGEVIAGIHRHLDDDTWARVQPLFTGTEES